MFLTRSLRRKMICGLGLVLVMLAILSLSGIFGLLSYRNVVNDPVFNVSRTPRQADLVAAIAGLFEPLQRPTTLQAARSNRPDFAERLEDTRAVIRRYRLSLDKYPPINQVPVTQQMLSSIEAGLRALDAAYHSVNDPIRNPAIVSQLQNDIAILTGIARHVPDSQDGFISKLAQARHTYRSSFVLVCASSAIVVLLFIGLVGFGYHWVFAPIRQLHQGACRVAQGDWDYRVHLKTHDEMAELADAFNQMTARFQEIATDLDRQVQERSRELVRSARLASVGFLAAGVAHEINNPLTAIKWTAESLFGRMDTVLRETEASEASVVRQYLDMIQVEALRCQKITARLLDFSRGQDATRSQTDLTALISEVLELVTHMSQFRNRTICFERSESCEIEVNGSEIKQVILNLVANALESMECDGQLEVRLMEQTDHVLIVVSDDGCGMTPETIENVFEPFFTERRSGNGTGLGLSISHRIVRDHGGRIEATSEGLGRGSTFRVSLPRKAVRHDAAA